jgi:hypothetical protein
MSNAHIVSTQESATVADCASDAAAVGNMTSCTLVGVFNLVQCADSSFEFVSAERGRWRAWCSEARGQGVDRAGYGSVFQVGVYVEVVLWVGYVHSRGGRSSPLGLLQYGR